MMSPKIFGAALLAAASLGLGACSTYDDYGYGYSSGVRVSVGSSPYWGWYDDYYYPGVGYYVYDRRGSRHRWNNRHRDYWYARRAGHRNYRANWSNYGYAVPQRYRDQRPAPYNYRSRDRHDDRRYDRRDRRDDRYDGHRDRRGDRYEDRRSRGERDRRSRGQRDRRDRRGDRRRDRRHPD